MTIKIKKTKIGDKQKIVEKLNKKSVEQRLEECEERLKKLESLIRARVEK